MYQFENDFRGRERTRPLSGMKTGAWMLLVAALSVTAVSTAPDAYARRQQSNYDNGSSVERAGAAAGRFAVTTLERMQEFDRANGVAEPILIEFMPGPPPQIAPFLDESAAPRPMPVGLNEPTPENADSSQVPAAPPLLTSFQGVVDNGTFIPPDTHGAVGPNHIAEFLNTGFTVFDRSGLVVSAQITGQAFWSALGTAAGQPASTPFDPRIKYDQYVGRWVVTGDANGGNRDGTNNSWVLVGISTTNDPTGAWNLFAIRGNANDGVFNHTNDWNDFPGLGLDPNNIVITNNMFPVAGGGSVHADVWVINKAKLIAGGTLAQNVDYKLFHNPCGTFGFTFSPAHTFGATATNYIVDQGWLDLATRTRRFLRVKAITGTGAGAVLACAGGSDWLEVAPYNFNQLNLTQSGCSTSLDSGGSRLRNVVWRNGKLWATHTVGTGPAVTDSAAPTRPEVAWYEFNTAAAGAFPGGTPNQQGRVVSGAFAYSYPSIAVNVDECVALGFSGSHSGAFGSAFYTGRQSTDPPGTMQSVSVLQAGTNPYLKRFGGSRNRWGDYSATMVDPVDDRTFWTVQEYATLPFGNPTTCTTNGGRWATWWGSFQCGPDVGGGTKWDQPPTGLGEDIASNIDWVDGNPNVVVADDFTSDGRPITSVRWWGSVLAAIGGGPTLLFDNGPLVTHPGAGAGGADVSRLQNTTLGMSTIGYNVNSTLAQQADDFTVPAGGWQVDQVEVFAYQTGSTTTSTFTGGVLQIWDGPPDLVGSSVIFGDLVTDRFVSTQWSNIYRDTESLVGSTARPVMSIKLSAGVLLAPGTYWLHWGLVGSGASGPFAPPITILGSTATGNAKQFTVSTGIWADRVDVGPQGFPFRLFQGAAAASQKVLLPIATTAPETGDLNQAAAEVVLADGTVSPTPVVLVDTVAPVAGEPFVEYGMAVFSPGTTISGSAAAPVTLVEFDIATADASVSGIVNKAAQDANVTASTMSSVGLVNPFAFAQTFCYGDWPGVAPLNPAQYYTFTVAPNTGKQIAYTTVDLAVASGGGGTGTFEVHASTDGFGASDITLTVQSFAKDATWHAFNNLDISALGTQTGSVEFRLYMYNAVAGSMGLGVAPTFGPQGQNFFVNGSVTDISGTAGKIDGWMVSFHEPLTTGGTAQPPLGLYFCDTAAVGKTNTAFPSCDGHPVIEYNVDLASCCLVHANVDSRSGTVPALPTGFFESECFDYGLDIQAVVGHKFVGAGCNPITTGNSANGPFWGWHSTDTAIGTPFGLGSALETSVTMAGADWLYGPWVPVAPVCSNPNMAFALITDQPAVGVVDGNGNGFPDVCECNVASAPVAQTIRNCAGLNVQNAKNRYLSFTAGTAGLSQAVRVTFVSLWGPFSILNGTTAWVDVPQLMVPGPRAFMGAKLSPTPVFADWTTFGVVHVFDNRIIPSNHLLGPATYDIQVVTDSCDIADPASYSPALTITNPRWADIAELCFGEFRAPEGVISVGDTLSIIASFESAPGAPSFPRTDLLGTGPTGPTPGVDQAIDVLELLAVLDAFSSTTYPFSFP